MAKKKTTRKKATASNARDLRSERAGWVSQDDLRAFLKELNEVTKGFEGLLDTMVDGEVESVWVDGQNLKDRGLFLLFKFVSKCQVSLKEVG